MAKKLEVGKNARFSVKWRTTPYDYSKDKENDIKVKMAKKYGIDKNHVKVVPEFVMLSEDGSELSVAKDVIANIQDPVFQTKLFKEYLDINRIIGYDFDVITKIDSELNQQIDYNTFEKYRRFSIKWVKWDNFLSYGSGNSVDFSQFKGLTLLNGHNQTGKTTVSNDLIHFLLFGTTDKYKTQDKIFNRYRPDDTNVNVEGCITIDGEDYIIKRTLSRPSKARRTSKSKVTQKVEYYKVVGDVEEELSDYVEDQQDESSTKTNKVIKEAIGNESDFNLMVSVTDSNLDDLINKKETDRGRLLSRWIGLLPLEEKDKIAREHFNQTIKPYLLSNRYNTEILTNEVESFRTMIREYLKNIDKYDEENKTLDTDIENLEKTKESLTASKSLIDENVMKIDITTLKTSMSRIKTDGKRKSNEMSAINDKLKEIGDVEFSVEVYDNTVSELNKANIEKGRLGAEYKQITHNIEHLKKSEYCPTCGRKLDNVDNAAKIVENEEKLNQVVTEGKKISEIIKKCEADIASMKEARDKYDLKNKMSTQKIALELNVEKLRNEWKELNSQLKEYQKNSEAIDKNNNIDIQIRNTTHLLSGKRAAKETNLRFIADTSAEIKKYESGIKEREEIIKKMSEEEVLVRNWKIYLDMIGKNGVAKMVLRRALPIINARLKELLSDVCDFDVEIGINDKNDVMFYIVKDGVIDELGGGSGFEKTAASLALRFVLGSVSTIPRLNYITLDEVWGRVEEENFENIRALLEKMLNDYDFLLLVSHQEEIKNWCEKALIAEKENNVSRIRIASMREK